MTTRTFAAAFPGVLLAVALLGACEAKAPEASATAPPVPEATPQVRATEPARDTQVASLAGEWRVAGIDGEPFDEPYGLALSGDEANLWWEPKCAAMWRTYRITGGSITFASPAHFRQPDGSTPPVCAIGLPPRLDQVFRALDTADAVARTPENGIRISGGGHSVLLFSQ